MIRILCVVLLASFTLSAFAEEEPSDLGEGRTWILCNPSETVCRVEDLGVYHFDRDASGVLLTKALYDVESAEFEAVIRAWEIIALSNLEASITKDTCIRIFEKRPQERKWIIGERPCTSGSKTDH